jgi:acyl-[acyl-carrier-protein]-phospholipid O-acyltransferase/long-chain-fatty-acid--[acyl-carrier-protein] ligase
MNLQDRIQPENSHLSRSFDWHNATQFLGALNDNIFRWLMVLFLIGMLGQDKAAQIGARAAGIFVFPFLLFTPYAGILADRFSKRDIIVIAKIAELVLMTIGVGMFMARSEWGVYTILFLMCTQSAFFGPCKYGIIPELVKPDQLSKANSFLEGLTYLAIVLGSAAAPILSLATRRNYNVAAISCVVVAAAGVLTSIQIRKTPASGKTSNASLLFFMDVWRTLKQIHHNQALMLAIFAAAYFMLLGAFAQINLIPYGLEVCKANEELSSLLFVVAAFAIGIGSYLAGKLSGRSIEFGIVPLGAIGMAVTSIILGLIRPDAVPPADWKQMLAANPGIFTLIFFFGISAGLFIVPIHAFIQLKAPAYIRGQVLAASNFIGWIGVLVASQLVNLCCNILKIKPSWMFTILGALTLVLAILTVIRLPDFLMRLCVVFLTRTIYRIRVYGLENVPIEGPALLICNHASWADPVLLLATQERRIRFLMDRKVYSSKWFNWLFRLARVIPISAADSPKMILTALEQARAAMDEGSLVCIFAEGTITRTGMLGRFRTGYEKIAKGTCYQIIPTYLGGIWGSVLSHYYGPLLSRWPRKLPYPVRVHFGKPLPADTSVEDIRLAIEELSCDYFEVKKPARLSLGETFIRSARKHWSKPFLSDTTGKRLTWGRTLIGSVALRDKLKTLTAGQTNIGIFLPPSVGAACTNLAIALMGKVAVNLSYVASESDRQYMIEQAEVKTILTSRAFLEKLNLTPQALPGVVFLEDLLGGLTSAEKQKAWLKARFCPRRILANARRFHADDTAVILFSSGSSGRPKGVLLSHHNILSNLEAALMVFRVQPGDKLCAILPLFHSFGLACTLWMPILAGVPACFVPNPLDGKLVGETIRTEKATLLFATPTFLLNYLRRCRPEDFETVRFIIAGAEKLKIKLIDAFEEKFGIRPREGYGATECSPLIAINVPDVEVSGGRQVGTKEGTAGHLLPGMAARVLHPETGRPVPIGESGVLWLKGPNIMKGYLNLPEKTAQVLQDGWYNSGDIVTLDRDGFITITDRLSRFSKIGGEMVPHMTIEETCMQLLGLGEASVAVTSLPDEKKGEQIVLVYDKNKVDPDRLYEKLAESDLPKLYIPKRENLIGIDEIPHLGSGKLDMLKIRQLAAEKKQEQQ